MKRHASMNRLYRILWSEAKQAFVVVSEIAKGHPKSTSHHDPQDKAPKIFHPGFVLAQHTLPFSIRRLLGVSLLGLASSVMAEPALNALPTGGQITQGSGSISQTGNTLNVQQNSDKMVGQWNSFDIGQQATVNFQQPNAGSIALNRINDSKPSEIYGKLNANGQVYLLNANGVIFGKTAQIDVGGLVASSQKLSDENFQNGKAYFEANGSTGVIDNQGQINAHGGIVAFIAPQVKNSGSINNPGGNVVMAAGEQVSLDFDGDGLITVKVDKAAINALAENKGLIQADGGAVVMTAQSANALMNTVVNNEGVIQARSLQNHNGRIILDGGDQGQTINSGTLDVSSNSTQGGQIQVTGEHIVLDNGAKLDASGTTGGGEVLVGGDWQGSGTLKQATTLNMKQAASIDVSAKTRGNGGKVVLWSNVSKPESRTVVQGTVLAKGGAISGNGGRIETSGHQVDIAGARISAGADFGQGGLWLIDPYDYTVDATVAGYISAALTASTSVTIDTASSPTIINGNSVAGTSSNGDITVGSNIAIAKTGGSEATLTLKATGSISMGAGSSITSTTGKLNTVLWADSDAINGGYVKIGDGITNTTISTNGGNVTIGGGTDPTTGYANGNATQADGVSFSGTISAAGGNISIRGQGNSTASAAGIHTYGYGTTMASISTTGTGSISLDGISGDSTWHGGQDHGVYTFSGSSIGTSFSTVNGDLSIKGVANATGCTTNWACRGVDLAYSSFTSTNGNITLSGNAATTGDDAVSLWSASATTTGSGNLTLQSLNTANTLYINTASVGSGDYRLTFWNRERGHPEHHERR